MVVVVDVPRRSSNTPVAEYTGSVLAKGLPNATRRQLVPSWKYVFHVPSVARICTRSAELELVLLTQPVKLFNFSAEREFSVGQLLDKKVSPLVFTTEARFTFGTIPVIGREIAVLPRLW